MLNYFDTSTKTIRSHHAATCYLLDAIVVDDVDDDDDDDDDGDNCRICQPKILFCNYPQISVLQSRCFFSLKHIGADLFRLSCKSSAAMSFQLQPRYHLGSIGCIGSPYQQRRGLRGNHCPVEVPDMKTALFWLFLVCCELAVRGKLQR